MAIPENLHLAGILLILAGLFVLFASIFFQQRNANNAKTEGGGFVLIGPFPIAFGSLNTPGNVRALQFAGILLAIIYAIWLLFIRK